MHFNVGLIDIISPDTEDDMSTGKHVLGLLKVILALCPKIRRRAGVRVPYPMT